ncbi:ARABIDOPSIS THALIANA WHITE-BROWN COMPLEX HOMOLOG PROTEIN 11, CUTICULAR DEFECT AND ORGAN FUSION 1 [Hibiscus trionum]|uniref:ARABIDOPSIS THALIANA WHITE-BROWN COMPLEX HOMOLOG PROTEIN 11, CUTICULAR DEFECT AND ORGAN FUSION 1 n=1 Tax=Hibiscus trionum TaxID=183268 RepID=A0A9W7JE55_HIBTR|nr:ARABIDOPSIS THALIANA WHITE-BROWN COMPLEX HOMOLOG PROTEIN 11, CUTICULAR DEFECT AND ORGAN FUSION 1 [Hibiscus trionum]
MAASFHNSEQPVQGRPHTQAAFEVENLNPIPESNSGGRSNRFMEDGVSLTWDDLWVTVAGGRSILRGLTGYARPGELLAIMGPSGCGKSTLLDTLAGRLGPNTRQAGAILINGRKQALAYGTSAYVTQDDALITTLTVKEAVYYSAQLQLPDTMAKSEKKERAEMTIREMGLQDAMDTRIGGWGAKGLSGGQKRRVSICIEILTRPKLLFLDEPTSGLDSAASYYVMSRITSLNQNGRTVIASIHQPSFEVFQLFTNLYLLSAGKSVYFGPVSAANEFFASNGFPCPSLQNPSDHFLKTINKDFDKDIELGYANGIPTEEVIDILVKSYKSSDVYQMVQQDIAQICKQGGGAILEKNKRQAKFFSQCHVLTRRSFINMSRDLGYYWMRLCIYIALAVVLGTVFSRIGMDDGSIQARGSLIMFVASFLTFMSIGGFPSFVEEMKIFERERLNGHYGVTAFVIGNTLSALPFLAMVALIPGAITYFLPGLHSGYQHFCFFVAILFACMMLVESLMMIVASLVPNFLMGIIVGAGIQGLMILVGGFFRLPTDLPKPVLKYPLYHIAFHKYAYQGLFKNEFEGMTFPNVQGGIGGSAPTITGEEILNQIWHLEMGYSKWVDLAVLFAMVVFYRLLFLVIVKTTEKMKPVVAKLRSATHKERVQVMVNPSATPL